MTKNWILLNTAEGRQKNMRKIGALYDQLKEGKYALEIEKHNKRSDPQNRYYWQILSAYIQPALYNEGWRNIKTKDDAHEFVKDLFLKTKVVNELTGEVKERTKSTVELTKEEFNEYLEDIAMWAAEYLYLTIPEPNQQLEIEV